MHSLKKLNKRLSYGWINDVPIGQVNGVPVLSSIVEVCHHAFIAQSEDEYCCALVMTKRVAALLLKVIEDEIVKFQPSDYRAEQLFLIAEAITELQKADKGLYFRKMLNRLNRKNSLCPVSVETLFGRFSYGYINDLPVLVGGVVLNHRFFYPTSLHKFSYILVMTKATASYFNSFLETFLNSHTCEEKEYRIDLSQISLIHSTLVDLLHWASGDFYVKSDTSEEVLLKRPNLRRCK